MTEAEKLIKIAENSQLVANANAELEKALYSNSEGGKSWYDRFWDSFQDYGNRTTCRAMFAGVGWNAETFRPKYKTVPSTNTAVYMFQFFNSGASKNLDYRNFKHLFDFSGITNAACLFQDARMDYIDIDLSNATTLSSAFSEAYYAGKKTHITLKVSEKCTSYNSCFDYCTALTDLFFAEGSVIAANINLQHCPLKRASIESVFAALSPTVTGKTATFKKSAKEAAFTADEWSTLIATKSNWTFSLI